MSLNDRRGNKRRSCYDRMELIEEPDSRRNGCDMAAPLPVSAARGGCLETRHLHVSRFGFGTRVIGYNG